MSNTTWGSASNPIPLQLGPVGELSSLRTPSLRMLLQIERGDSLDLYFRAYREVTGGPGSGCACNPSFPFGIGSAPQILTGLTGGSEVRKAIDHPQIYPLGVDVDQTGAGSPTRGIIRLFGDASITRMLPGTGVWDLELGDGTDALRKTLAEGPFALTRDVSV